MDADVALKYTRWMNFQHGANALMGFIEAKGPDGEGGRMDFHTHYGWDGDNIATTASILVWSTAAIEERGFPNWLQSLGWERALYEEDGSEEWTFLLQLVPDPYK